MPGAGVALWEAGGIGPGRSEHYGGKGGGEGECGEGGEAHNHPYACSISSLG